jgi:hypothetical protein
MTTIEKMNLLKKNSSRIIITALAIIICLIPFRKKIIRKMKSIFGYSKKGGDGQSAECINCPTLFNDLPPAHKKAYENNQGIKPQQNFISLDKLLRNSILVELKTNSFYIMRSSTSSKPYILPRGFNFIQELSQLYMHNCKKNSVKYIPFEITSTTRTLESVKQLMRSNSNAIKESAHLKGKTFDISYRAFKRNKKQLNLFIQALDSLHKMKKCYVKFEKNGCLHITAN